MKELIESIENQIKFNSNIVISKDDANKLLQALISVKSEPMNYESQKAIQDNLVESYPFKKSESAEEVEDKQNESAIEYAKIYRCPATNKNEYCKHDIISAFNAGAKWMHDFVNNSKAMKENKLKVLNGLIEDIEGMHPEYILNYIKGHIDIIENGI